MWTQFWDMHSGGGLKEPPYHYIYIEAPEEEAVKVFYNRFGHNPFRVTCTCCGEDYSVSSEKSLAQLTAFHRNCWAVEQKRDPKTRLFLPLPEGVNYYLEEGEEPPEGFSVSTLFRLKPYITLEEYKTQRDVLIITESEIKPEERTGEVPEQGYVWR